MAGYLIATVVIFRVVWGFIGPQHARFSDFVKGPGAVLGYLGGLTQGKSPRYVGHNPAGGAMAVALLACLAATVYTGMVVLAEEKHQGPLAPFYAQPAAASVSIIPEARADDDDHRSKDSRGKHGKESAMEETHEFFANLTLVLIGFHLIGVVSSSLAHRENLVQAMITGTKKP